MKAKKLEMAVKNIPCILKSQPKHFGDTKYEIKSLSDLNLGPNNAVLLSCKVTNTVSKKGEVPA